MTDEEKKAVIQETLKTKKGRWGLVHAMAPLREIHEKEAKLRAADGCYSLTEYFIEKMRTASVISKDMILEEYDKYWEKQIDHMGYELFSILSVAIGNKYPELIKSQEPLFNRFEILDLQRD